MKSKGVGGGGYRKGDLSGGSLDKHQISALSKEGIVHLHRTLCPGSSTHLTSL